MAERTMNKFEKRDLTKNTILKVVRSNPGIQPNEIVRHIEKLKIATEPTIYKYLDELIGEKKLTKDRKEGDDKSWYYRITKEYVESVSVRAELTFFLMDSILRLTGLEDEREKMAKDVKDCSHGQLWILVEEQVINKEEYEKIKSYGVDVLDELKRQIKIHAEIVEREDGMVLTKKEEEKLINYYEKLWMLNPVVSPLIESYMQYAYKIMVRHLLDSIEGCSDKLEKKLLSEISKCFLDCMVSSYKPKKTTKITEDVIISLVDDVLDTEPTELYNIYMEMYELTGFKDGEIPTNINGLKGEYEEVLSKRRPIDDVLFIMSS